MFFDRKVCARSHMRCPKCLNSFDGIYFPGETIESFIRYPETCAGRGGRRHAETAKELHLIGGLGSGGAMASFSIDCPRCGFGSGGGLNAEDYERLRGFQELRMIEPLLAAADPQVEVFSPERRA